MANAGAFGENFPYTNFHDLNLDWILKTIREYVDDIAENKQSIEELENAVEELKEEIDNFDDATIKEIVLNYLDMYLAKMIFVEINDAGYIVYYIPDSWQEITFNTTGMDIIIPIQPDYGHLVLSY